MKDFYPVTLCGMFDQSLLLTPAVCSMRNVRRDAVHASFTEQGSAHYEVLLEVSTNKFLVNMVRDENGIQSFEIVAMKGFMEITTKIIDLLKRLIVHLWEMMD